MALIKCEKCEKEISDDTKVCIHCGAPVIKYVTCPECGETYPEGAKACPKCGKKSVAANKKKNLALILIIALAAVLIGVLVVIFVVLPAIEQNKFDEAIDDKDYEEALQYAKDDDERLEEVIEVALEQKDYKFVFKEGGDKKSKEAALELALAAGDYEFAYKNSENKQEVLKENLLAHLSNKLSDNLKNPNSFKLHHAWLNDTGRIIIVEYEGTNSYGGVVSGYVYYSFDADDNEFQIVTSFNDFDQETYSYYDSEDERLEKLLKNLAKKIAEEIIANDDLKFDDHMADRINALFKENKLKDVKLHDNIAEIYPVEDGTEA